jgi:two-component system, chemotaxis family, protein-glutamate methylesterase/glutaminase
LSLKTRVLIVDDSAFARKVLREALSSSPELEVVGVARDGLEALEKIAELAPDVITLDLVMPNLDGLGVLQSLPAESAPRVIVVSISDADSELGVAALQAGAIDIVQKPTALATAQLYELTDVLIAKVTAAARARTPRPPPTEITPALQARATSDRKIIVIGTSTGGPQALTRLLLAMPADLPVPVAIALHIPPGFTRSLAERLDKACALTVREAEEGLELRPGLVVLARGGAHLEVRHRANAQRVALDFVLGPHAHAPSVDRLFRSAAAEYGAGVLGVVLTGMGDDGTSGSAAIRRAGGDVLTESESSCVVYGMPRSVVEAGHSSGEATLETMAAAILGRL